MARKNKTKHRQADWLNVCFGHEHEPTRTSTSDSSCTADRPRISTLDSDRESSQETFQTKNDLTVKFIYHCQNQINISWTNIWAFKFSWQKQAMKRFLPYFYFCSPKIYKYRACLQWTSYFPLLNSCAEPLRVCSVSKFTTSGWSSNSAELQNPPNIVLSIIPMYLCLDLRWDTVSTSNALKKKVQAEKKMHCFCKYAVLKCTKCTWLL